MLLIPYAGCEKRQREAYDNAIKRQRERQRALEEKRKKDEELLALINAPPVVIDFPQEKFPEFTPTMPMSAKRAIREAAERHKVSLHDILSDVRTHPVLTARGDAIVTMRDVLGMSYPHIGKCFGKDHTTIMAAYNREKARRAE